MRIGLIGPGNFAERGPFPAIAATPGIELVAVQGRTRAKAEAAAARWGAGTVCDTVGEIAGRSDVDAVFIVTPPGPHAAILDEVIAAGKPFICDKPVTLSSRELAPRTRRVQETGLPNAVNHQFRYEPAMARIADLVREGAVGRVRNSVYDLVGTFANDPAFSSQRYWSFHHSASQGGGLLPQVASHHVDLHRFCLGDLEAKGGFCPTMVSERPQAPERPGAPDGPMKAVEVEDCAALAGKLASGGAAALSFTNVATSQPDLRWLIHGDQGSIVYSGQNGWFDGKLMLSQGWMGEAAEVAVPALPRHTALDGMRGWLSNLICELLLDFSARLGSGERGHRFATLADELAVWELIEQWRGWA